MEKIVPDSALNQLLQLFFDISRTSLADRVGSRRL